MSLSSTSTTSGPYNGDGSTTAFPIGFVFWDNSDIKAIKKETATGTETTLTFGTHYTLSGGSGKTGTLTTTSGNTIASGFTLLLKSNRSDTQNVTIPAGGSFPSTSVEEGLDKGVRLTQQRAEELGRALKFTEGSTYSGITIADPVAGKILRWNSTATGTDNVDGTAAASSPTSVADGGTGATTVAGALTNLGLKQAGLRVSLWRLGQF